MVHINSQVPKSAEVSNFKVERSAKYIIKTDNDFKKIIIVENIPENSKLFEEKKENNLIINAEKDPEFIKNPDEIKSIVNEIISEAYPQLKNAKITFKMLKDDSFYFQSNFELASIFKKNFDYIIMINPEIFERDCPKEAVKAILAHELTHTLDYKLGGNIGVLKIGLKMIFPESSDEYEHQTDLKAIARGYGNGLIEYRNWVYKNIPKEAVMQKRKSYYQPEEIKAIQLAFAKAEKIGKKEQLLIKWLEHPPIGIDKINSELSKQGL